MTGINELELPPNGETGLTGNMGVRYERKERIGELEGDIATLSLYSNDAELDVLISMLSQKLEELWELRKARRLAEADEREANA